MIIDSNIGAEEWQGTRILPREAKETCRNDMQSNTCEKPGMSTGEILIILLIASLIAVCCLVALLCVFHRRKQRLDKLEDIKDVQELDDYGLGPVKPRPVKLPQAPPSTYDKTHEGKPNNATDENWDRTNRNSTDSLTPSLRQAMGVTPRDTLANN
ncbi:hypothetical protein FLAG1_06971 [Fusarium langsethiae]|uniref:Uncharacterized protein n=1 Tax=Fusarium langsethiae TaxID=179993 RepID=A0A0N0V6B9_FUSLA|nr:hypothetical protein FLAG1_06971 [Fusarium langsethiae]GKU04246.1 unnamed protein product [Fusarium langsethiae]